MKPNRKLSIWIKKLEHPIGLIPKVRYFCVDFEQLVCMFKYRSVEVLPLGIIFFI